MAPRERSAVNPWVKYLLFFENVIFWLAGLTMAALCAWILIQKDKKVRDAIDFFLDPSTLLCAAGALVVVITVFGCMGALRENTCCLKTFNYILGFLFLGEIVIIVLVFVFYYVPDARKQLGLFPDKAFADAIEKYGMENDEDMQDLIDNIQRSLHCCGLSNDDKGYLDWTKNDYFNCSKDNPSLERCSVPPSCCKISRGDTINILCGRAAMQLAVNGKVEEKDASKINTDGCLKALGSWIEAHALVIGGVLLGILLPQIFVICLSRTLTEQIKTQKSKWRRLP